MRVLLWVQTDKTGSICEDIIEFEESEAVAFRSRTPEEREDFLEEMAREYRNEHSDSGYEVLD